MIHLRCNANTIIDRIIAQKSRKQLKEPSPPVKLQHANTENNPAEFIRQRFYLFFLATKQKDAEETADDRK